MLPSSDQNGYHQEILTINAGKDMGKREDEWEENLLRHTLFTLFENAIMIANIL